MRNGANASAVHVPVLARQCLDFIEPTLNTVANPVVVDATVGLGGHSELILSSHPKVVVIGIDRDERALEKSSQRLAPFGERFVAVHTTYDRIDEAIAAHRDLFGSRPARVQSILMDLGVSSMQLDDDSRGFAYSRDTALDMRMDQSRELRAWDLVNTAQASELASIISRYGEERFAKRIASFIERARNDGPIDTTGELADLISQAIPDATKKPGSHPAKRTFQALRIAVNDELSILADALPKALEALDEGGRLVVESYHSLEDRIVKNAMRRATTVSVPDGIPLTADQMTADFRAVTAKAVKADSREVADNPRSASVRLRVVEKTIPNS